MSEIRPALTPEQWARTPREWQQLRYDAEMREEEGWLGPHAEAALALYGQPFGFTHEDVELLRAQAKASDEMLSAAMQMHVDGGKGKRLRSLADRIEALLPPTN